jgi:nitroreductase
LWKNSHPFVPRSSLPPADASIDILLSRVSVGALGEPAPDAAAVRAIVEAALRAPDHGKLRPWRFIVIRGDARHALGDVFARALAARDPNAPSGALDKERAKPLRAPVLIAVVARVAADHKIPEVEQLLSAGAATMNMLNAIHALGYGGVWLTGGATYDPAVQSALGLTGGERLVGFVHVGTPTQAPPVVTRPDAADYITEWNG